MTLTGCTVADFLSFLCTPATGLLSPKSHMLLQQVLE